MRYANGNAQLKGIVLPRERWRVQTTGTAQPCQGLFLKGWWQPLAHASKLHAAQPLLCSLCASSLQHADCPPQ